MAVAILAGLVGQDVRIRHGRDEMGMATYRLGFYGFDELTVSNAAGQSGMRLPNATTQRIGIPGERFVLARARPEVTTLLVEDDNPPATDGSVNVAGPRARIAAGSGFGLAGQAVDLACRLTVTTSDAPVRSVTLYVLGVGGTAVGLVGPIPLQPGVTYTITDAADQQTPANLHSLGLGVPITPDMPGQTVLAWSAIFCFTFGTLVDTPDGARLIEALGIGDLVTTLGNGSQALRWAGSRAITTAELANAPDLQPVEFAAGTIGNSRPLRVSPQHRILLNDWRAQVYFGEDEVLIPAKAMINGTTIRQIVPEGGVTYIHLLFDRHEILVSEGALSESFHPGETGLLSLDKGQRQELDLLFPGQGLQRRRAAYPIVKLAEARALRLPG